MRSKNKTYLILKFFVLFIALACVPMKNLWADEDSKYLEAVREFADNVLKYGRDTYGPKHTPLFVDGLNVNTHEPVKWIAPNGDRWILSNLASQQNLFRTLDGLTRITGDPKYKQAAMDAIKYALENLRSPNGLLYWGGCATYDPGSDQVRTQNKHHDLKYHYPYYELMWEVDSAKTRDFIESLWAAHILDWSNLDMDRIGLLGDPPQARKGWDHEYVGGPVFFLSKRSWGNSFFNIGSDLFYAAGVLSRVSGDREPLVWAKRLAHRYVETRYPDIGISGYKYTITKDEAAENQLGEDFPGHTVHGGTLFPLQPRFFSQPQVLAFQIRGWICAFFVGDLLDRGGEEFEKWALEELTAWARVAYRSSDNSLIPMLTDGTSLEGYVLKKDGPYGTKGTVFKARHPDALEFWAYALAYRITSDEVMWDTARSIARGNSLGEIGKSPAEEPQLQIGTDCSDPHAALGFLELFRRTGDRSFLEMALRIGDNILVDRFNRGFFVPSKKHIYTRFDAMEPLVLLHLHAALRGRSTSVPQAVPSESWFSAVYRGLDWAYDVDLIYPLTESIEPPISLVEAAKLGNAEMVRSLISAGVDVNGRDRGMQAPIHTASRGGHKDVLEILIEEGADTEARDLFGDSALHIAVANGHKEVAEVLISQGADVNIKNNAGKTPLDIAIRMRNKDIAQLLVDKGAKTSLSVRLRMLLLGQNDESDKSQGALQKNRLEEEPRKQEQKTKDNTVDDPNSSQSPDMAAEK
jgi:pectate lyase